jgi:hypothetical protein
MKKQVVRLFILALLMLASGFVHGQTLSVLYDFGTTANDPTAFFSPGTLAQGSDGNIYTTSSSGGIFSPDYFREGTVFSMSTTGALSLIYTFEGGQSGLGPNGFNPYSGLTLGTDGNFYGTTPAGGVIDPRPGVLLQALEHSQLQSSEGFMGLPVQQVGEEECND